MARLLASAEHYNYFRDYDPAIERYVQSDPIGLEGGPNTFSYADNAPTALVDPTGEAANFVIGGLSGLVMGYAIAQLTGDQCYDWKDALADAALGAAGAGLISKLNKLRRIRELRQIGESRGLQNTGQKGYAETWKNGPVQHERLVIKHESAKHATGPGSQVPRFEYRIDAGKFWDPFTGRIGPKGPLSHVPLEPTIPLTSATVGSAAAAASPCGCSP